MLKKVPSGLYRLRTLHLPPAAGPFDRLGLWTEKVLTDGGRLGFGQVIKTSVVRHTHQVPITITQQQHSSSNTAVRRRRRASVVASFFDNLRVAENMEIKLCNTV